MFSINQIRVGGCRISQFEPIRFIWFVERRIITRVRHMAFQEDSWHFGRKLGINYHLSRVKPCWFRDILRPIEWSFMAVSEDKVGRHTGIGSKFVDTLDDRVRSREFDKTVAFENKACRKIKETIGALYVTRGAKANRRYST